MRHEGLRIRRTHDVLLNDSIERVFPLFGPIGEKNWSEGWHPNFIYPSDGKEQPGLVFTVEHPDHSVGVWTMVRYDSLAHEIGYVVVNPGINVTLIDISCAWVNAMSSRARVTYTVTSISAEGEKTLEPFTERHFVERIFRWQTAINHYLDTGERISHPEHKAV